MQITVCDFCGKPVERGGVVFERNGNWYCKKCGWDVFWKATVEDPIRAFAHARSEITRLDDLAQKMRESERDAALIEAAKVKVCCGTCLYFRRMSQSCSYAGCCDVGYNAWVSKYEDRTSCAKSPAQNTKEICRTAPNTAMAKCQQVEMGL